MYKEVAFDPACMADIAYYNLIKQHFGFDNGRYISADVKAWAREAMGHVKESDLKPVRKQSVKNYLNKISRSKAIDEFLLTRDRQSIHESCWHDWVEEQQKVRQFSCIVSDADGDDQINIDMINDGCTQWKVAPSVSIPRNPNSIIEALYPLLVLSEKITLIDQYFRLFSNPVLEKLFRALGTTSVRSLRVASSVETLDPLAEYKRTYQALNLSNVHFEWIIAPDKYFHDRYLVTEVGAIRSGQGFMADSEKGAHSDLANLNIIGQHEADRTLIELEQLIEDGRASIVLKI